MCGIAGIVSLNTAIVTEEKLLQMSRSLAHRGPNGEGLWRNNIHTAGFAHRRLAIIDRSELAAQPMHYRDRYTIVFNGAVYNYKQLRKTLMSEGYQFLSEGDTEVVIAAFTHYRENCVDHFDGMFAFAIWDKQTNELFIARDRFGEKPFYYSMLENSFYFGSEMKALWAAGVPKNVDPDVLGSYLATGHTHMANNQLQSFFAGINSLPAAHYGWYKAGDKEPKLYRYFDISKKENLSVAQNDAQAILDDMLQKSIRDRLVADVEIGSSLSGGLDSSAIVAMITGMNAGSLKTFSAVFPGFNKDESYFINKLKLSKNIESFSVQPTALEWLKEFEKLCYHQEEPFSDSGVYAQFKVFELAANNNVQVLLDGQGADEIFAGYTKYIHWFLQEKLRSFRSVSTTKKQLETNYEFSWSAKNYLAAQLPAYTAIMREKRAMKKIRFAPYLHSEFAHYLQQLPPLSNKGEVKKLNDILYQDVTSGVLPELLRYADKNSMAHGVEVRLPFLNHYLVKFIFSLPADFKINNGYTKSILRKIVENKLDHEIVYRKGKIGFETPQESWMNEGATKEALYAAKESLIDLQVLNKSVLAQNSVPKSIHAPDNFDFRFLCAAEVLKK